MRHVSRRVARLPQVFGDPERANVLVRDLVPHPVLNEDVRRHVHRVRDGRNDLRVGERRLEGERRMHRIVERVNDVVRGARMVGVAPEHLHRERARLHLRPVRAVIRCPRRAQHRQRIKRRHFVVIGKLLVETLHGFHVRDPARAPLAVAPECLDGLEESFFTRRRRLGQARGRVRSESRQDLAWILRVLFAGQGVVVTERLAPVREREVRLGFLRELELRDRLLPAEAVQDRDGSQEVPLRFRRGGCGEREVADVFELGGGWNAQTDNQEERNEPEPHGGPPGKTNGPHSNPLTRTPPASVNRS